MKINIKKGYAAARKDAYGSIEEQLDLMYHEGFDAWMARQKEIKDRFPKTEEATNDENSTDPT